MVEINDITRPSADLIAGIKAVGAATASATLAHMGIRNCHITGPVSWNKGKSIAGPALTLQFMPKREDLYGADEYAPRHRWDWHTSVYEVKGELHVHLVQERYRCSAVVKQNPCCRRQSQRLRRIATVVDGR